MACEQGLEWGRSYLYEVLILSCPQRLESWGMVNGRCEIDHYEELAAFRAVKNTNTSKISRQ
jgi:hypothetical protein